MEILKESFKELTSAPIPFLVILFGGIFVSTSISSNDIYIFESFLVFIYGIFSAYLRILRKDEKTSYLGDWFYYILQVISFIIWSAIILYRVYNL